MSTGTLYERMLSQLFSCTSLLTPCVAGTSFRVIIWIIISESLIEIQISVYFIAVISISIVVDTSGVVVSLVVAMCVVIIAAVETKSCSLSCHLSSDSVSFILVQKRGRASGKSEPWFIS